MPVDATLEKLKRNMSYMYSLLILEDPFPSDLSWSIYKMMGNVIGDNLPFFIFIVCVLRIFALLTNWSEGSHWVR